MSEPFLLLASILPSGLVSLPPTPFPVQPQHPRWATFNIRKMVKSALPVAQAYPVITNTTQPEFSSSNQANTIVNFSNPVAKKNPVSGSQLYQLRKAALKAGKLYTRVRADYFYDDWSTATKQPTYGQWKHLLAQEARAVGSGQGNNKLGVIVGDSLSMWFPSQLLPYGKLWLNQGISGENSAQVLRRLQNLDSTRPDNIYVMVGVNDLRQGATDATIFNNTKSIVRRLRQNHPQSQIVVQSILPTNSQSFSNQRIQNLNRQIMAMVQKEGANYLNLYPLFLDGENKMRKELTTDGIHLSTQGYQVWQRALQRAENLLALRIENIN